MKSLVTSRHSRRNRPFSPRLAKAQADKANDSPPAESLGVALERRDEAIRAAFAAGRNPREIAAEFGLAVSTVQVIRRQEPRAPDEIPSDSAVRAGLKSGEARRRRPPVPSPLTAEVEYTEEQWEYIRACDAYRQRHGRRFLNSSEYLHIAKSLGYERPPKPSEVA